jgi:hypothetical protein
VAVRSRIGLRQVRSMKPGETIWDASLTGFGARRQKSDAVAYVLFYRTAEGRQRWFTIGRHGAPWTPEAAREEARRLLGDVAHQRDPAAEKRAARNAQTVAELCDLYFADAEAGRLMTRRRTQKKASTLAIDKGRIASGRLASPSAIERRVCCGVVARFSGGRSSGNCQGAQEPAGSLLQAVDIVVPSGCES